MFADGRGVRVNRRLAGPHVFRWATLLAALFLMAASPLAAEPPSASQGAGPGGPAPAGRQSDVCESSTAGSPYIPVDSWVYPAVMRLYSLGFVDTVYLGMRPWTRSSVNNMLDEVGSRIEDYDAGPATDEAARIYTALTRELRFNPQASCQAPEDHVRVESVYSVARGISGTPLRDSYHLGSTIINDYGRPYQSGFNNYSGVSGYASAGRFLLHVRGEFHEAPSAAGYSTTLAQTLANQRRRLLSGHQQSSHGPAHTSRPPSRRGPSPQSPMGASSRRTPPTACSTTRFPSASRTTGSAPDWAAAWPTPTMRRTSTPSASTALNRCTFRCSPCLTGPFRYEFLVGSLKGHTYPNDPWVHVEKISFRPTENLEFGFERTVIWGGKGHEPINLHTFLRSFFSLTAPDAAVKNSPQDPGARFGAFDFSYRLPFVRNWLTLYSDSEVHDDVSPIDAPRRASWRPGLYLSHVPGIPRLDLRVEAASTDPPITNSNGGHFMYYEYVQQQGYTNQGQLFGDWIGREDKGGQGWITYHLSGNEWLQVGVRNQKAAKDFIPGGTTLNDISFQVVKRIGKDFEVNGNFAYERWKAPIYLSGQQTVTTTTIQLTWFPERKVSLPHAMDSLSKR